MFRESRPPVIPSGVAQNRCDEHRILAGPGLPSSDRPGGAVTRLLTALVEYSSNRPTSDAPGSDTEFCYSALSRVWLSSLAEVCVHARRNSNEIPFGC